MYLKKLDGRAWTGFWLRKRKSGAILWIWWRTFGFHKMLIISWLTWVKKSAPYSWFVRYVFRSVSDQQGHTKNWNTLHISFIHSRTKSHVRNSRHLYQVWNSNLFFRLGELSDLRFFFFQEKCHGVTFRCAVSLVTMVENLQTMGYSSQQSKLH